MGRHHHIHKPGDDSHVDLLKAAVKEKYDYYHLITGVDLPLKSNEEIANFFESHREKEFVDFDKNDNLTKKFYSRFERFHFRKRRFFKNKLLKFFFFSLEAIGELLGFVIGAFFGKRHKRFSRNATFMKGSAYFDITHDLADYIVNQEQLIKKLYCYSICCDEVFLQTIVYNSPFKEKVTDINTRYIDWNTHANNPKTLTIDDYNSIKKSNCLFARKFSSTQSRDLIKKLYDYEV